MLKQTLVHSFLEIFNLIILFLLNAGIHLHVCQARSLVFLADYLEGS